MKNSIKNLLIIILVIFTFLLIYKVHLNYPYPYQNPHYSGFIDNNGYSDYNYPLHGDEWTHLAQATYLMENKNIPEINPYLKDTEKPNLESGFHSFLAQFFTLTNLDPILNYQYLPAIFAVISLLTLIILVVLITNNSYVSLLASLFFLSIKNNVNLMGIWFLVPLTFSIFLIYLFWYCLLNENKKLNYLSVLFYITSMFTYPFASIIMTFIFLADIIIKKKIGKKYLIIAFILIISALLLFKNFFTNFLKNFIFQYGWTGAFEFKYSVINMYGLIATILALMGVFYLYKKKFDKTLMIIPLMCLIPVIMYSTVGFTLLISYQRAFFYLLIYMTPLSAIGLYYLLENIYNFINKVDKNVAIFIIILITTLIFINQFNHYYEIDDRRFLPLHFVNNDDYLALKWIKENYGTNNLIMTNLLTAFGVYPINQNYVVAMPLSNLGGGDENSVIKFYSSDCQTKKDIILKKKINLVYSYDKINCDFLKEVYNKKVYIYNFN